jgi:acyl phosphate:glycerol-3-phosphate acyltransferase
MNLIFLIVAAYFIGSIPTAVWVGKWFYGIDVREHGSRNPGTTNTFRVLGWKAGIPVFIIDVLKGWLAVKFAMFSDFHRGDMAYINFQLALGFAALFGHIFPVFAKFKGGKGVASLLGMTIAITPLPALTGFGIFTLVLLITKYVSLGSMTAGLSYPIMLLTIFNTKSVSLIIFSIIITLLLIVTHRKNILRLLKGEESKAGFLVRKRDGNKT